jgi:hypothetical protein
LDPRQLYLDLLKKAVTATLYAAEPNHDDPSVARFVQRFSRHYIAGVAQTMTPIARLDNVERCVVDVLERGVPGDLLEAGVWRGGMTIFMRGILKAYGVTDRRVWVADSFEGLPQPDAERFPLEAKTHSGTVMKDVYRHFAATLEEVKANFARYGLLDEQVRFLAGWFADTLGDPAIERIALLRLDGDYYESTMDALVALHPKLSPGGYVIVDDYGEGLWTYCRRAVDDFRERNGIRAPLVSVDSKCVYWRKENGA